MNIKVSEIAKCIKCVELAKWRLLMKMEKLDLDTVLKWCHDNSRTMTNVQKRESFPFEYFWTNEFVNNSAACDLFSQFKAKGGGCFCPYRGKFDNCYVVGKDGKVVPQKFALQIAEDVSVSEIMRYIKKLPVHKVTKKLKKISRLWNTEIRIRLGQVGSSISGKKDNG